MTARLRMISSVKPSAKSSLPGSEFRFSSGSTAITGRFVTGGTSPHSEGGEITAALGPVDPRRVDPIAVARIRTAAAVTAYLIARG